MNFRVGSVSFRNGTTTGDFWLDFYEVDPGPGGNFEGDGASFGNRIVEFHFPNTPLLTDPYWGPYFIFEGLSVQMPQHFGYLIQNQS